MTAKQPLRVLIVDNSMAVQGALAVAIGGLDGLRVEQQVFTGREAVEAIRATKPEIVLLDVQMPDGSGINTLEAIRGDEYQPLLIVITFAPEAALRARCISLGVHAFFDKAIEAERLFSILSHIGRSELTLDAAKLAVAESL